MRMTHIDNETREKLHALLDYVIDRQNTGSDTNFEFAPYVGMAQVGRCYGEYDPRDMTFQMSKCYVMGEYTGDNSIEDLLVEIETDYNAWRYAKAKTPA